MSKMHHDEPNYFFVFQNKSFEEESRESYLWAPKRTLNGARVSHWELMTEVRIGDYIIHSYQKQIKAISRAKSSAYTFENPKEGAEQWMPDGWKIDVEYFIIDDPIITSDFRDTILKLQPKENAPFNKLGKGNTGYLFRASKELFDMIVEKSISKIQNLKTKTEFVQFCLSDHQIFEMEQDEKVLAEINQNPYLIKEVATYSPVPESKPNSIVSAGRVTYMRDPLISARALARANHVCEVDSRHQTFIRKSTDLPYMEPHHLIPMSKQSEFEFSLDVEANIVSLCSNCHNQIHYGKDADKIVRQLFISRKEELSKAGIDIDYDRLLEFY